jgi:hypothetical protein
MDHQSAATILYTLPQQESDKQLREASLCLSLQQLTTTSGCAIVCCKLDTAPLCGAVYPIPTHELCFILFNMYKIWLDFVDHACAPFNGA